MHVAQVHSSDMDASRRRSTFVEFCSASKTWERDEYPMAVKLCVVSVEFVTARLTNVFKDKPDRQILYSYQSHATSFVTRMRSTATVEQCNVSRSGSGQADAAIIVRLACWVANRIGSYTMQQLSLRHLSKRRLVVEFMFFMWPLVGQCLLAFLGR